MAVSSAVAAGIGVACSAFTFLVSIPIVLWIRPWLLNALGPEAPDPFHDEMIRLQCSRVILDAIELDSGDHRKWTTISEDVLSFSSLVSTFVRWYAGGTGQDANAPADPKKLHRLAGGSLEDWFNVTNLDKRRKVHALTYFICRVLWQRMIPTGDCSITLLPANMLVTYQQVLTKLPTLGRVVGNVEERQRSLTMLRQHWRAMTAFCISENYENLENLEESGSRMPDALPIHYYHGAKMPDDDPRMPNILAVEALLKDALGPFWTAPAGDDPDKQLRFESSQAKESLREITATAADIALKAFSQTEPVEFYWPATGRRDGPDPYGNGGYLHCFGVRQRQPCPGAESTQYKQVVKTANILGPIYNDTHDLLRHLFRSNGHWNHVNEAASLRQRKDANDGEEAVDDKEWRELLEDRSAKMSEYLKWHNSFPHETSGWNGATDFF